MSSTESRASTARRVRVERNIYRRPDGRFELGYRDSTGKQRWQVVDGGITAARTARDTKVSARGRGEVVKPNPRLTFGVAADRWLAEQVSSLRPATQASYRNSIETHLRPRWGNRRLDTLTPDDAARLVRELRAAGRAETTIATILQAAGRVFVFARRRCAWHGDNPIALLENSERAKLSLTERRRIFQGDELQQTLAAAREPWRTLFAFAATTGGRISECLGLVWADLDLSDVEAATVSFAAQVDRKGQRSPLKTDESRRTVELPRSLAAMLLSHRARSPHSRPESFVFASRSGRALGQRNVSRALRATMIAATDERGRPTFPILHERDERGRRKLPPRGAVPSFHGYRHTAASDAIAAGDGVEEVSWQLGHRNSNVTRAVYVQEVKSAERTARRRAKMEDRYGAMLRAAETAETAPTAEGVVVPLRSA